MNKIIGRFVPNGVPGTPFNVLTKIPSDYMPPAWEGIKEDGQEYHVTARAWTFEQYEATGWDGTNLPPVGCDVEYHCYPDGWVIINIVARIKDATFIEWKSGTHKGGDIIRGDFPFERVRPLRSEAERKRDAAIEELTSVICGEIPDTGMATAAMYAARIYDATAAGKIPGVKLEV